jgi:hypothetical protein
VSGFIVLWSDENLIIPYGWNADCDGAIESWDGSGPVAVFPDRKAAQKAIRISAALAKLNEAQGKPGNTDFTKDREHVRVVPLWDGTDRRAVN